MPSVITTWAGQLRDRARRAELGLRIAELANVSQAAFGKQYPPDLRRFEKTIEGDVLLSVHVFATPPTSPKVTRIDENYYAVRSIGLTGLEFRLYGANYEGDDRISFVFTVDEDPGLDGLLVYFEDSEECRQYEDKRIQQADYYLAIPHVHLRYYMEECTVALMAWIKHFYIQDLIFWKGEYYWPDPELLNRYFAETGNFEAFEKVKRRFVAEIESMKSGISEPERFWTPPRGLRDEDAD
jgi:hypothetical protein